MKCQLEHKKDWLLNWWMTMRICWNGKFHYRPFDCELWGTVRNKIKKWSSATAKEGKVKKKKGLDVESDWLLIIIHFLYTMKKEQNPADFFHVFFYSIPIHFSMYALLWYMLSCYLIVSYLKLYNNFLYWNKKWSRLRSWFFLCLLCSLKKWFV